jgi:hypothetical protein
LIAPLWTWKIDSASNLFKALSQHEKMLSFASVSPDFPLAAFAFRMPDSVGLTANTL